MNAPIPVTLAQIIKRARSVVGEGKYLLGAGGRVPSHATPFDEHGQCDCSGFVAWCLGQDRFQPSHIGGNWIETTDIVADATGPQKMFERVYEKKPGYVIVYADKGGHQGHVGIISTWPDQHGGFRVIHCSMGNYRTKGVAIAETGPDVFTIRGAITVRFKLTVPDVSAVA
jgi:CHAP domain-containing protein